MKVTEGRLYPRKNPAVLWTFVPRGILLNNTDTNKFLELLDECFLVWTFADGMHSVKEIALEVEKKFPGKRRNPTGYVRTRMSFLLSHGFLQSA